MTGTYTTASGLVITDRRHTRAFPRDGEPNDNPVPDPPEGVGPSSSEGYGNTHVMYDANAIAPPMVQAWSGWPVEWATPTWGAMVGIGEVMRRSSTVWAAIDKNAMALAAMPRYRTRNGELVAPVPWMRNPQPEVYTGWFEAFRQVVTSVHLGEAFLWATSYNDDGTVRTWVMLNPGWVNVEMSGHIRTITLGGLDITADVLHIRYSSWPGDARGHGPLEAAATNLVGAEAMERYAADLAVRGGIPWAVLTAEGRQLTAQQAADARTQFVLSRIAGNGAPAVLSGGFKLEPLTINPKDMALLELRGFEESRLSVLLGCPPELLALPSQEGSMTYKNIEGVYEFHWRSHLRPVGAMLMEAISQWALTPDEAVELNADEYTRPPFSDRATAWQILHGIVEDDGAGGTRRAITVPEIRRSERLDTAHGVPPSITSIGVTA